MKALLFTLAFCVAGTGPALGKGLTPALEKAQAKWQKTLTEYVTENGGVDYQGIAKNGLPNLKEYLNSFANADTRSFDDATKTSLYINFYNSGMIFNLLRYAKEKKIDVGSSKFTSIEVNDIKIPGGNIWSGDYKFKLNGNDINLDGIEHGLIRGGSKGKLAAYKVKKLDPRIHSAVNCAAMSCPILRTKAYTAENLNSMLEENMVNWLNDDTQFRKVSKGTLQVNSIVIWYYSDFDDHAQEVLKIDGAGHYLEPYIKATTKDAAWKKKFLKDEFSDRNATFLRLSSDFKSVYDWKVSDIRNR